MLSERSKQVRRDTIELSSKNGGYHYGGCFSCTEILITLYATVLTEDDVFILSKGHACWPLYVLLREKGHSPKLKGHPERDPYNGIVCSTGSMGHGFPVGVGIALAKKIKKEKGMVFVLVGDGECQEGTTWESLLIASKQELGNLIVIVDNNEIQGSGFNECILPIKNFSKVVKELGWVSVHINGHNERVLKETLEFKQKEHLPTFIIADTVKGKGVSFMENKVKWHANWLDKDNYDKAMKELV